jgi:2-aminoadipate transaminase
MSWTLARRAQRLNPSTIREILKVTERPGIVSLAGGLPAADSFPVEAMAEATARVLHEAPGGPCGSASPARQALQYAASEGYAPLREWVAESLATQGLQVDPGQVLITTGSQQGLDLVGKVLIDPGSAVAVESPTYLGALQAFAPYEAEFAALEGDDEGPLPQALTEAAFARFAYLLPNFQNPSGRCLGAARRQALVAAAAGCGLPIVEDNPYGDLWFDQPPPPPLSASAGLGRGAAGAGAIYLGSFSKVLAPGLRLGYLVAPTALYPKLLQAKQAADLHTPGFNQRVVYEVIKDGFLDRHVPTIRARYRAQRDALAAALDEHLRDLGRDADGVPAGCRWTVPQGGMFFWVELPPALDATALLPRAVDAGMAYVPGAPFYARAPRHDTLRLSFVTASPAQMHTAVAALAGVLRQALQTRGAAALAA